jgi:hypothetical protein
MSFSLEYHVAVRRSISVPCALFSLLVLPAFFVPSSSAQINTAPSSATSSGLAGHAVHTTTPSVASATPKGNAPNSGVTFSSSKPAQNSDTHQHHHYVKYAPPVVYAIPVPYAVDIGATDADANNDPDDDADYQGGPTIFDRRGLGADSYVPPVEDTRPETQSADADLPSAEPPPEPTLLIFKDGRKIEVVNYAIVGETFFDLTPGHPRKVALADLDLDATEKQNDDHGIVFRLPIPAQAN